MRLRRYLSIIILLSALSSGAQTLGGSAVYTFLKLPSSPFLSAAGGANVSYTGGDVGLAASDPAMLTKSLQGQVALNFNSFFAGVKAYQLAGAFHKAAWNTTFAASLFYVDYGSIDQTDIYGNTNGSFRPKDMSFQLSAASTYLEHWQYGLTAKFIQSNYGQYSSSGLAFDVGLLFSDTARFFSAGIAVKNMGGQLKTYNGTKEEIPFDLQVGITKRLAKAPFGFSLTAQQLHQFNSEYNDTTFNNDNGFTHTTSFGSKLINHFVLATHIYLGANLEVTLGYNFLRRYELNLGNAGNGLNGFSAGFRAKFNKIQVQYSRAYYQRNSAYNQFGINLDLKKAFGIKAL